MLCFRLVACTEVRSCVTNRSERDIAVARRFGRLFSRTVDILTEQLALGSLVMMWRVILTQVAQYECQTLAR